MRPTRRIPPKGTRLLAVPREHLLSVLSHLGEESRSLLLLHELEGHTYAGIAEMTGYSAATVRTRVVRAKRRFDSLLLCTFRPSPEIIALTEQAQRFIFESPLDGSELLRLTPREFEELVAEVWRRFGYEVELTARTKDGGARCHSDTQS
jgi:hypothetical protein